MRKCFFVLLCSLCAFVLKSQDNCGVFFPFYENTTMKYAAFDKKGELKSFINHRVAYVDDLEGGGLKARVETVVTDEEGIEETSSEYRVTCQKDVLSFDLISLLSPQMTQAFSGMELEISGDGMSLPGALEAGQELPDARTEVKAGNLLKISFLVTNRKVEAQENITTGSGATYECYKIRYTMESKMLMTKTFEVVEWFAKDFGLIRSETYNKKGNLESATELQAFSME